MLRLFSNLVVQANRNGVQLARCITTSPRRDAKINKTTAAKKLLKSPDLSFVMEAHSGLSARIAEEAGFKGIFASGLSISALLGVRDCNEASWTQVLDVFEYMSDTTTVPIIIDADTGFGNFNNARRLVRKCEQRGVAGVCIEDRPFPKASIPLPDGRQVLADQEEFALKIKACKDTQEDPDFCVIARVEAFVAGWGLDEALRRADAYLNAGADAIFVHSGKTDASEIESFMKVWKKKAPVVIAPINYHSVPTEHFRDMGISMIIWANQNLRASITAMKKASAQIFEAQSVAETEKEVVPFKEIFRLQGEEELKLAEKKYLPRR